MLFSFILLMTNLSFGQDQESKELIEVRNTYQADLQKAIKPINDRFLPKLQDLKKQLVYKGDIKGAVAVDDVITSISNGQTIPQGKRDEPKDLEEIRNNYSQELNASVSPLKSLYIAKLEVLKQQLALNGSLKAALAVEEEMDKVKSVNQSQSSASPSSTVTEPVEGTLTVDAKMSVFGAGNTQLLDLNAMAPAKVDLPSVKNRVLKINSATGYVAPFNDGKFNYTADGGNFYNNYVDIQSYGGISGVIDRSTNGCLALMGVFTNGVPKMAAPPRMDVTHIKYQTIIKPSLNQSFFIGDGLTGRGSGEIQEFIIPDEATELSLGFADGFKGVPFKGPPTAYFDNVGELVVTYSITVRK